MKEMAEVLAEFTHSSLSNKADPAREIMRLSLLDWCAAALAGQAEPVAQILRASAIEEGGQGQAGIFGASGLFPARAAALVNGTTSHALDYDDTHFAHIGHPSVAIFPAALAVAQAKGRSGKEMLDAALTGAEASVRFGLWLGRGHYQIGFHQTSTAGAFGACVATARLMGLSRAETVNALALTASRAAGLKAQFGTMAKPYHAGMAAEAGVVAASLAAKGFVASPAAIDGPIGFGATHSGAANEDAFDNLGQDWLMEHVSHKFHACCHGTHAMIEALSQLASDTSPKDIVEITVNTHNRWMNVCNIVEPKTGLEVKFSYAHLAAMVLNGIDTTALSVFSQDTARDPGLCALAAKVRVQATDRIPETAAFVVIKLSTGETLQSKFDLDATITLETRRNKLLHKAEVLLGAGRAEALWQVLNDMQGLDLQRLLPLIFPPDEG